MNSRDINEILHDSYSEKSFRSLSGAEAVRSDPTRYITQTDKMGIYYMVTEILDNSVDENLEVAERILKINPNMSPQDLDPIELGIEINQETGECTIWDQGRGIAIEPLQDSMGISIPALCAVFERDNTGSKGRKSSHLETGEGYSNKTMGVHGAGAFVVMACSEYLEVENRRLNKETGKVDIYKARYQKGFPVENSNWYMGRLEYLGSDDTLIGNNRLNTGIKVTFKPDLEIMTKFNPLTNKVDNDYFFEDLIKRRIVDTLSTVNVPFRIYFKGSEGNIVYDSRELALTLKLREGQDYVRAVVRPEDYPEIWGEMKKNKISDFYLDLVISKTYTTEKNKYVGFVNRIKVESSPHISEVRSLINKAVAFKAHNDPDLQGFFRQNQLIGLEVIPMLYVDIPEWDSQVKTSYSGYQVSNYMGRVLAESKLLLTTFDELITHCFQLSKPLLMAEKSKEEEMKRYYEEIRIKEMKREQEVKLRETLSDSLHYLNRMGKFKFNRDIEESDLLLVEGRSGGSVMETLGNYVPDIAHYSGLTGKIDNILNAKIEDTDLSLPEMARRGMKITPLQELDVLLKSNFRRFLQMFDNDSDGLHIRALMRLYIWRRHRNIIEQGRLYDVIPPYCDYKAQEGLKYEYNGEVKTLKSYGQLKTVEEYEAVKKAYPGKVKFTLFKGVGSVSVEELYKILRNPDNWEQVPPLTEREEYELTSLFVTSSEFKRRFTQVNYLSESAQEKTVLRKVIYKDTSPSISELVNENLYSDYPVFTSVSRKTLEDYRQKGSSVIEVANALDILGEVQDIM